MFVSCFNEGRSVNYFSLQVGTLLSHSIEKSFCEDLMSQSAIKTQRTRTHTILYAPTGTGKTLLAKSVADSMRASSTSRITQQGSFYSLKASDVVRGEIGNSEKIVTSIFESAYQNSPSIIFIDEFQALFTERGSTSSSRLTTTLLQCMDSIARWNIIVPPKLVSKDKSDEEKEEPTNVQQDGYQNQRVVVLGATNAPWMIDKAFLRSGRFDRVVHVGLPTALERKSILKVHVSRMKLHHHNNIREHDLLDTQNKICAQMADQCDLFSGADLAALCRAAAVRCLRENYQNDNNNYFVEERHFDEAKDLDVNPSSDQSLVNRLIKWHM